MCAVPSIEVYTDYVLERKDFPELADYDFFVDRRRNYWEVSITGRQGGCLCGDSNLNGVIYRLVKRLMGIGYPLCYLPNDIREDDMSGAQLKLVDAIEKYPPTLGTPPIRVDLV